MNLLRQGLPVWELDTFRTEMKVIWNSFFFYFLWDWHTPRFRPTFTGFRRNIKYSGWDAELSSMTKRIWGQRIFGGLLALGKYRWEGCALTRFRHLSRNIWKKDKKKKREKPISAFVEVFGAQVAPHFEIHFFLIPVIVVRCCGDFLSLGICGHVEGLITYPIQFSVNAPTREAAKGNFS